MGPQVEIKPPTWSRVWVIGFTVVWCGGLVAFAVPIRSQWAVIVPVLMLVFGLALGYRLVRLGAVAAADTLVVRNNFHTRRLSRADLEGFRIGPANGNMPIGRVVFVLLKDQSLLQIDASLRTLSSGRRRLDQWLTELHAWLAEDET